MKKIIIFINVLFLLSLIGCGAATIETEKSTQRTAVVTEDYPEYNGVKRRVQIIKFGISEEIAKNYPELADKRVGWGLYNRLIDGFYDTNRFEFVEEKSMMKKKIMDEWDLSQSGLIMEDQEIESEGLSAPEFLVYAEVYDFAISHSEEIVGGSTSQKNTTIIGIQLRIEDISTREYIPSSGMGEASSKADSEWKKIKLEFDQSTVGLASERAVKIAILKAIKRFENKGW